MPYRRLPNTDQARIRALKLAVDKDDVYNMQELAISLKTMTEAKNFLTRFEGAQAYYKQCFDNQISSNRKYQGYIKIARLYVSHFIQVLNLAVLRSEIKEEAKKLYGLETGCYNVPDLTSEAAIAEWGKKVINGEKRRLEKGGAPIYNPAIAKVSVHYEIFLEAYEKQKSLQNITAKSLDFLAAMRNKADEIILEIWNQTEKKFEHLPYDERMIKCKEYGVVYYYRTVEKKKMKEKE